MHMFWLGSFRSNHAISYINYFVFSEFNLVCLTMTDESKETKYKFFVSIRLYGSKKKKTELKNAASLQFVGI